MEKALKEYLGLTQRTINPVGFITRNDTYFKTLIARYDANIL